MQEETVAALAREHNLHEGVAVAVAEKVPVVIQQLHRLDHHLVHVALQQHHDAINKGEVAEGARQPHRKRRRAGVARAFQTVEPATVGT